MWKSYLINKLINWCGNRSRMFIKRWTNESIDKAMNDKINKWVITINRWRFLYEKMFW